jgi:hypothetical protein
MSKRILLVEPDYKNKYPPLGLMKISTYHRLKGDVVHFTKGCDQNLRNQAWDRIYISTLFTFYWNKTIKTIKFYKNELNKDVIYVGGVLASLMPDEILQEVEVNIVAGLINNPQSIDYRGNVCIDSMIPDYGILKQIDYKYSTEDAFIGYATRGCPNKCKFCAVNTIEPEFVHYLPLKKQIEGSKKIYGDRKDLLLMDNNILASKSFEKIIYDIIDLGYHNGAKYNNKLRYVDFNQGVDARLFGDHEASLLSKIALKPLRLAFDDIRYEKIYTESVRRAVDHGINKLSNYILFNYTDTPEDFYKRLKINIELNNELDVKIYSFPMKYIPLNSKNRKHISDNWNKKYIRGIQCILLATRGKVGPNEDFFNAAFGENFEEFIKIISMPEEFIIFRNKHKNNGALEWENLYRTLSKSQLNTFHEKVLTNKIEKIDIVRETNTKLKKLYQYYV